MIKPFIQLHEYKGEQMLFIESNPDVLTDMVEIAKIQSTEASNKIEGIYTSNERLKMLIEDKTLPKSRNEQEIAGYRDVLNTIHEAHDFIPPKPSIILQLHRDLCKFGIEAGGKYKNSDNIIAEIGTDGEKHIRFQPVAAWETPIAIEELCIAYEEAVKEYKLDPLLIIPMFVLDFLCLKSNVSLLSMLGKV